MISLLRPATLQEIESISPTSDITPTSEVWAWPSDRGGVSDMVVLRQNVEADPIYFAPESGVSRRFMFWWGLANSLKARGFKEVYCTVDFDSSPEWTTTLEKLGFQKTTEKPQYRYKLNLG